MKTNRASGLLGNLVLAVASAVVFAGIASAAPAYKGRFTLPFDAQWGGATLPAGDYTFTLNSAAPPAFVKIEQGNRNVALVMAHAFSTSDASKESELIVTRSGGRVRIRVLHLAELGTDLYYTAPKAEGLEMAGAPELIQRVPIMLNGK